MRFITEFERDETPFDALLINIRNRELSKAEKMGRMIGESFGWQNPVNDNPLHHRLEIEAFPMDKWVDFKRDLFAFLDLDSLQYKTLLDRVSDLESFGKPSGDTITNQQLNK